MSGVHALLSPSSAERWLACPGSVDLSRNLPDITSSYALEGSAAHVLAKYCFEDGDQAVDHLGKSYAVGEVDAYIMEDEMCGYVQIYLDYVRRESYKKKLLVEQRLPLTQITGEKDAFGTADAIIIDKKILTIVDLKYGIGNRIFAEQNEQLMIYAAAAAIEYGIFRDFDKFKLVIVQPRLDHIDEWEVDAKYLHDFVKKIKKIAPSALDGTGNLNPGEEQCRFCRAKVICPALGEQVSQLTFEGFDNLDKRMELDLSKAMASVGMVEDWCTAIRAETERRLVSGVKVAGWKLVSGRMGARQWSDVKQVEETMKSLKISDEIIYKKSLVTPTQAEKALLKTSPDKWNSLQALITQKQGAPSVAPSTDPREEIGAVVDSFEDLGKVT